jgi:hypothetical protein
MSAFENARKFFVACEAPEGWEGGVNRYVAEEHLSPRRASR